MGWGTKIFVVGCYRKSFCHIYALIPHQRMHIGIKTFECTDCRNPFSWKYNLTRHLRVPTGEEP